MKKKFPTDKKTNFLIADDIRQEVSGKAIIIGYCAGETIALSFPKDIVVNKNNPVLFATFCFLWVFTDGEGEFEASITINYPDGSIKETPPLPLTKNTDGAANLLIKFSPFEVYGFGEFECCVDLGEGHLYKRKFHIINKAQ
jgi:hypothetical protein